MSVDMILYVPFQYILERGSQTCKKPDSCRVKMRITAIAPPYALVFKKIYIKCISPRKSK